jgi:tight adherence protein B
VVQEAVDLPDEPHRAQVPLLERLLRQMRWWPRFETDVAIARFTRSAADLVAITALVTVITAALVGILAGTAAVSLIVVLLGPFVLHSVVRRRLRKQRETFGDQLAAHIDELASAMRAGHGLVSALAAVARSATEPSRGEWTRVVSDEQLGKPLDEAMRSMAQRMQSPEIEQVALVASLHHRTGGNMAEVLERVAEGVRERTDLRRELRALTAQARLSRWVVSLLPPGLIGIITVLDRAYMRPLFTTTGGVVMVGISLVLLIIGSLVMRRLTEIKV